MEYTITVPDDVAAIEDPQAAVDDINAQLAPLRSLLSRIRVLADAGRVVAQVAAEVADVLGRTPGGVWRQPLGAHDVYLLGAYVRHAGHNWTNTRPMNDREPGTADAGWTDEGVAEGEPPAAPVAGLWVEGTTYAVGDLVAFDDKTYSCVSAHTAHVGAGWTPVAVPSLWTEIN